ncbi:hypothetical protein ACLD9W_07395 [Neisseria sp. WLZKY-1]|uniref:hypothetical protein n=1 Tax=Neisseria sp. WLZKY-1 TaxID=3390377 RepID=UPI00397AC068
MTDFAVAGMVLGNPSVFGSDAACGVVFGDDDGAFYAAVIVLLSDEAFARAFGLFEASSAAGRLC